MFDSLCVANAGSGKTRVLTYRVAYLITKGIPENDENLQAQYIADEIIRLKNNGISYKEMAVLVRTGFLTKTFEMAFQRNNIPYKVLAGFSFFERQHIRDVISFLKFYQNTNDETVFIRIASLFQGIGVKTAHTFYNVLKEKGFKLEKITEYDIPFRPKSKAYKSARYLLEILSGIDRRVTIEGKLRFLLETFYDDYMKYNYDDYFARRKDIEVFIESSFEYADLDDFLSDVVLEKSQKK